MLFTAKQVMTTGVVCVKRDTRIEEVVELFEQHRVSGLPVVDRQQRLLGVITEYDLLRSITALKMRGTVAEFMTRDVISIEEDASLTEIAEIFLSTRVRRVPVTRDGKVIGVISRRDLIFIANIRQRLLDELPVFSALAEAD